MKKLVLLLLILAIPVSATTYLNSYISSLPLEEFPLVTCQREARNGNDLPCCINSDKNAFCDLTEQNIGECFGNWCMFNSATFQIWYSWRYKLNNCKGMAVMGGKEFKALFEWAGCEKKETETYWCCSPYAFPPKTNEQVQQNIQTAIQAAIVAKASKPASKGALLILNAAKWRGLELGQFKRHKPEQRALQFEKSRCALGGGKISIIDAAYGSFFYDKNNLKPGMRAFYLTESEVTPLVTWCK